MISFEESYFKGHFRKNVGNFQKEDLERLTNWYWGWVRSLNKFVPLLACGKGKKFLEIGCGIGPVSNILYQKGYECDASDISSYSISRAKKLNKNIRFFQQDITESCNINSKYDLIIAFEVIEHLKKVNSGIKNMIKMLKEKGILICSTPFPCKKAYDDPTHINIHDKNYWEKEFKKNGLNLVKSYYTTFLPLLYKLNKNFSFGIPFKTEWRFINSTTFIIGEK